MAGRVKLRAARGAPEVNVPGQLGLFGSPEPWQPTGCRCWPIDNRGCGHCRTCSACGDCGRCAGQGCACGCDDG